MLKTLFSKFKKRNNNHVLLFGVGFLLIFILLNVLMFFHWKHTQHVGTILTINESSLILQNPHHDALHILLTADTRIVKGRETDAHLEVGDTILVVGETNEQGMIVAHLIRIVTPEEKIPSLPQQTTENIL